MVLGEVLGSKRAPKRTPETRTQPKTNHAKSRKSGSQNVNGLLSPHQYTTIPHLKITLSATQAATKWRLSGVEAALKRRRRVSKLRFDSATAAEVAIPKSC